MHKIAVGDVDGPAFGARVDRSGRDLPSREAESIAPASG